MTVHLKHNTAHFAVKATTQRQFTGLASTWDLDFGGDVIEQGAYKRSLGEITASGRVVPLINQHQYGDARHAIGKMISASETDAGLEATFQVVNSPEGDEFLARIKDGIIDGLSIGYEARGQREPTPAESKLGILRVLTDVELREVSLVIWGMNSNALIDSSSVKTIAASLAGLKRESLNDDDRKTLRQIASLSGALLRTATPPADTAADAGTKESPIPPNVPPADEAADAPKAYESTDALRQRVFALRIGRLRHTIGA